MFICSPLILMSDLQVSKVYHSSSEEEEHLEKPVETNKVFKKKKPKEDKSSAEFKAKMTERFLKKQKLAEEEKAQNEASNTGGRKSKKNDGKYYSDSDEDSDGEEEKGQSEVLEKLQTFAGDLWKDSDDEGETGKSGSLSKGEVNEEEESSDEDDEEEDSSDEEDEEEKEGDEEKVVRKKPMFDPSPMIRYDPLSEGQENYLRGESKEGDAGLENEVSKEEKPASSYTVTSDLKAAFNSSKGFSFGFGGNKEASSEKEKTKEIEATDDWDAIEEADDGVAVVKKSNDDVAASFGRQLRVKGVDKTASPFFFTPNDSRFVLLGSLQLE